MLLYLLYGAACLITGFVVGLWVEMVYASAAMSRSQHRMQNKVRQAREEAQSSLAWRIAATAPDDRKGR
jgi:uncharacterized membrane protein YraQ (UPF0718 family)